MSVMHITENEDLIPPFHRLLCAKAPADARGGFLPLMWHPLN
jgi:hypothetical protein